MRVAYTRLTESDKGRSMHVAYTSLTESEKGRGLYESGKGREQIAVEKKVILPHFGVLNIAIQGTVDYLKLIYW